MKSKDRAKLIDKSIRIVYSSLESHLELTYRKAPKSVGNMPFHRRCIREYSELIYLLSKLY